LLESAGFAALNITAAGPAELDKTLAVKLLPLDAAGLYSVGARIIGAVALPVSAMTASALPRLFREGRSQPQRTRTLLRWMFASALAYSAALGGALWLAAPVFAWIFGSKYHGIEQVIRWLCLAIPGMALRRVAGNALMSLNRPWARFTFEASGLAILTIASIVATAHAGTIGLPIALSVSEWVMAGLGILLIGFKSLRTPHRTVDTIQR
jgi:O-antigen/teichoic acid export membrane protein